VWSATLPLLIGTLVNTCWIGRALKARSRFPESVPEDALSAISPYLTEHINRFGDYTLNLDRKPPQPDYGYTVKRTAYAG
jgi:hypothetical protein